MSGGKRLLIVTPEQVSVGRTPDGHILVPLEINPDHLGLAPGIGLALRMSPAEARQLASHLVQTADAAEAEGQQRH